MAFRWLGFATGAATTAGFPYEPAFGRAFGFFFCELSLVLSAVLNALEKPLQAKISRVCKRALLLAQKWRDVCSMPLNQNRLASLVLFRIIMEIRSLNVQFFLWRPKQIAVAAAEIDNNS